MDLQFNLQFTGTITHKVDPKNRVAYPAVWRDEELTGLLFFNTIEEEYPIVKCFTKESFTTYLQKKTEVARTAGFPDEAIEIFVQKAISNCYNADLNSQGKILLPKALMEHLKLEESVSFVGVGAHFKLWNPKDFDQMQQAAKLREDALNKIFNIL